MLRLLAEFKKASSTYTIAIAASITGLCKAAQRQSLGRNKDEQRESISAAMSKAEADVHTLTTVRTSKDQLQQLVAILV